MGNFFNSLAAKLQTFMMGRNGSDKLALVCLIAAVVVGLVNSFVPSIILMVLSWALLIYSIFRCLSTNVAARQAENEKFENLFSRLRGGASGSARSGTASSGRPSRQARQRRSGYSGSGSARGSEADTITFQCEQCGQKLSVPKGKGTLKVTCPKCHHQQKVNS